MTPQQIALVQSSWQQVLPIRTTAADLFYARLFEVAPEVRTLFRRDVHAQGAMLMSMLDAVVTGLSRLDQLLPTAQALARRHVGYGVQPRHYDSVGSALLWTLEQGLGPAFGAELRTAWAVAYETLAAAMKQAAYGSEPEPLPTQAERAA
jgi:hemoglobin-like flavoprotein